MLVKIHTVGHFCYRDPDDDDDYEDVEYRYSMVTDDDGDLCYFVTRYGANERFHQLCSDVFYMIDGRPYIEGTADIHLDVDLMDEEEHVVRIKV